MSQTKNNYVDLAEFRKASLAKMMEGAEALKNASGLPAMQKMETVGKAYMERGSQAVKENPMPAVACAFISGWLLAKITSKKKKAKKIKK